MIFKVRMLAFHGQNLIREVNVPDEKVVDNVERMLDLIYYYGQNEIQNVPRICSLSVGDCIEYKDELYFVASDGFTKVTHEQYDKLMKILGSFENLPFEWRNTLKDMIAADNIELSA